MKSTSTKCNGRGSHINFTGLFFLKPGTTMNGQRYLNLMKEKLQLHMSVHDCTIFMQDRAPCYRSKITTDFF